MPRVRSAALPLLVLLAALTVVAGTSLLRGRYAAWTRPAGPTADRVLVQIRADGRITATYGPTSSEQTSLLSAPVRLRGTLPEPNAEDLERLMDSLIHFSKPRQRRSLWHSLDLELEIEVDEEATTAWLSWVLHMAQWPHVGLTNVELRRMPSGRLIPLDLPALGESDGPRPSHKEEPRTYIRLRRGRLPPKDDRQVLKVGHFHHHVGDEVEIWVDGKSVPPPPNRYVADLPAISRWHTTAGRRLLTERLRHVRRLLREDLSHLDEVPLDVIVAPLYTRFADFPAYIVLDVLEGLQGLPNTRLQYEAMVERWQ